MPHPSPATVGEPRWYKAGSTGGWRFAGVFQASMWPSPRQDLYVNTHQSPYTHPAPAQVQLGLGPSAAWQPSRPRNAESPMGISARFLQRIIAAETVRVTVKEGEAPQATGLFFGSQRRSRGKGQSPPLRC